MGLRDGGVISYSQTSTEDALRVRNSLRVGFSEVVGLARTRSRKCMRVHFSHVSGLRREAQWSTYARTTRNADMQLLEAFALMVAVEEMKGVDEGVLRGLSVVQRWQGTALRLPFWAMWPLWLSALLICFPPLCFTSDSTSTMHLRSLASFSFFPFEHDSAPRSLARTQSTC